MINKREFGFFMPNKIKFVLFIIAGVIDELFYSFFVTWRMFFLV